MNNGGIARRLVNCAQLLTGRIPGSLAQTNIVTNMLFGAISGSGSAAAAAIGGILGGAFTATEACAIAVVYALLLSTIYKVIASWQDSKKEGAAPFNLGRAVIGAITPPVGTVMFTGVRVANTTIETVIRKLLPFFAVTILILMLVTYIEPITMWLPRLFELVG